jgi:hypothetical protein
MSFLSNSFLKANGSFQNGLQNQEDDFQSAVYEDEEVKVEAFDDKMPPDESPP